MSNYAQGPEKLKNGLGEMVKLNVYYLSVGSCEGSGVDQVPRSLALIATSWTLSWSREFQTLQCKAWGTASSTTLARVIMHHARENITPRLCS